MQFTTRCDCQSLTQVKLNQKRLFECTEDKRAENVTFKGCSIDLISAAGFFNRKQFSLQTVCPVQPVITGSDMNHHKNKSHNKKKSRLGSSPGLILRWTSLNKI